MHIYMENHLSHSVLSSFAIWCIYIYIWWNKMYTERTETKPATQRFLHTTPLLLPPPQNLRKRNSLAIPLYIVYIYIYIYGGGTLQQSSPYVTLPFSVFCPSISNLHSPHLPFPRAISNPSPSRSCRWLSAQLARHYIYISNISRHYY